MLRQICLFLHRLCFQNNESSHLCLRHWFEHRAVLIPTNLAFLPNSDHPDCNSLLGSVFNSQRVQEKKKQQNSQQFQHHQQHETFQNQRGWGFKHKGWSSCLCDDVGSVWSYFFKLVPRYLECNIKYCIWK